MTETNEKKDIRGEGYLFTSEESDLLEKVNNIFLNVYMKYIRDPSSKPRTAEEERNEKRKALIKNGIDLKKMTLLSLKFNNQMKNGGYWTLHRTESEFGDITDEKTKNPDYKYEYGINDFPNQPVPSELTNMVDKSKSPNECKEALGIQESSLFAIWIIEIAPILEYSEILYEEIVAEKEEKEKKAAEENHQAPGDMITISTMPDESNVFSKNVEETKSKQISETGETKTVQTVKSSLLERDNAKDKKQSSFLVPDGMVYDSQRRKLLFRGEEYPIETILMEVDKLELMIADSYFKQPKDKKSPFIMLTLSDYMLYKAETNRTRARTMLYISSNILFGYEKTVTFFDNPDHLIRKKIVSSFSVEPNTNAPRKGYRVYFTISQDFIDSTLKKNYTTDVPRGLLAQSNILSYGLFRSLYYHRRVDNSPIRIKTLLDDMDISKGNTERNRKRDVAERLFNLLKGLEKYGVSFHIQYPAKQHRNDEISPEDALKNFKLEELEEMMIDYTIQESKRVQEIGEVKQMIKAETKKKCNRRKVKEASSKATNARKKE